MKCRVYFSPFTHRSITVSLACVAVTAATCTVFITRRIVADTRHAILQFGYYYAVVVRTHDVLRRAQGTGDILDRDAGAVIEK